VSLAAGAEGSNTFMNSPTTSDSNSLRINTSKSVSKQRTLSLFRMNTCERQGGGGLTKRLFWEKIAEVPAPFRGVVLYPGRVPRRQLTVKCIFDACANRFETGHLFVWVSARTSQLALTVTERVWMCAAANSCWSSGADEKSLPSTWRAGNAKLIEDSAKG
jgi:hypothetical protein